MVVSKCLAKLLEFSKLDFSLLILGCTRAAAVQLLIFYMSTRKGCETVLFFGLCIGTTCAHSTVFVASTFSTECTTVVNQIQNIEMVLENGEVQLGHYTVVATLAKYFHAVNLCLFG